MTMVNNSWSAALYLFVQWLIRATWGGFSLWSLMLPLYRVQRWCCCPSPWGKAWEYTPCSPAARSRRPPSWIDEMWCWVQLLAYILTVAGMVSCPAKPLEIAQYPGSRVISTRTQWSSCLGRWFSAAALSLFELMAHYKACIEYIEAWHGNLGLASHLGLIQPTQVGGSLLKATGVGGVSQ